MDIAVDGISGEYLTMLNEYDAIILDRLLPRQDGRTTCQHLQGAKILTPIIMLTAPGGVHLRVYDVLGRVVQTLLEEYRGSGPNEVLFDARGLAGGVYICRLDAGPSTVLKKMILLRG